MHCEDVVRYGVCSVLMLFRSLRRNVSCFLGTGKLGWSKSSLVIWMSWTGVLKFLGNVGDREMMFPRLLKNLLRRKKINNTRVYAF